MIDSQEAENGLRVGDLLPNGAMILALRPRPGTRNRNLWMVLAYASESVHPYVTWTMEIDGTTFWGNYYEEIEDAVDDFMLRSKEEVV